MMIYLIKYKPFDNKISNALYIVNESILLIILGIVFGINTIPLSINTVEIIGYVIISFLLCDILFIWIFFISGIIMDYLENKRIEREKKKKEEEERKLREMGSDMVRVDESKGRNAEIHPEENKNINPEPEPDNELNAIQEKTEEHKNDPETKNENKDSNENNLYTIKKSEYDKNKKYNENEDHKNVEQKSENLKNDEEKSEDYKNDEVENEDDKNANPKGKDDIEEKSEVEFSFCMDIKSILANKCNRKGQLFYR